MSATPIRVVQRHFFNTFQERGVLLPFTSPALVGTRMRRGRETLPELQLPNPSGGLGFYILTWPNVRALGRPTVHDMQLYRMVAQQPALTPTAVLQAARAVALQGLAGRPAAEAAAHAQQQDARDAKLTASHLLYRLVEQMEPADVEPRLADDGPAGTARRCDAALAAAAAHLGQSLPRVQMGLDRLGVLFNFNRGGHVAATARPGLGVGSIMLLIETLEAISQDIASWETVTHESSRQVARELSNALKIATIVSRTILSDVDRHTDNPLELLGMLFAKPDQVANFAGRPEWSVNGWEQVAVRWRFDCDSQTRIDMLDDIRPLIPPLPKQAADWSRIPFDFDLMTPPPGPLVPVQQIERSSRTLELTGRLEVLQSAVLHPAPARSLPNAA